MFDKNSDQKILAEDIQTAFCISLTLINTGSFFERMLLGFKWLNLAQDEKMNPSEAVYFFTSFFYLGANILSGMCGKKFAVNTVHIAMFVGELFKSLDNDRDNCITFAELSGYFTRNTYPDWINQIQQEVDSLQY